jgi:hypothetical protein
MKRKILALLIILIVLFGCAKNDKVNYNNGDKKQENGNAGQKIPLLLEFNKPFKAYAGQTYSDMKETIAIYIESIDDSRCPAGTQCIWAGELGITMNVNAKDDLGNVWKEKIYLGEIRAKKAEFLDYVFKLVSITEKYAEIVVEKKQSENAEEKQTQNLQWFSIKPAQCGENTWEEWFKSKSQEKIKDEKYIIIKYMESQGIKVEDYAWHNFTETVCAACSCPRGDEIAILVDSKHAEKLKTLGWKKLETEGCNLLEVKICPNGKSAVIQSPFCEFNC